MEINEEDKDLFRQSIAGIKPLHQDRVCYNKIKSPAKQLQNLERETQDTLFFFSDNYEPALKYGDKVRYLREGEDSYLLKQLRRGDFAPEIFLDLHGLTKQQAKRELASLILECQQNNLFCASIMTGYGTYTLKQQIPCWLVQHPNVRAIHSAPREYGGDASVLVLFDR